MVIAHELDVTPEPVAGLHTYHRNPRRGDVTAIRRSLAVHGQYRPIIANRGTHTGRPNEVLAGNHTLIAARDEGWSEIAVCWLDVDDDQAARIVLADNRTADLGDYDDEALAGLLGDLPDLDGTAYTNEDLAALLGSGEEGGAGGEGEVRADARRGLAERFIVPPMSLLDARQGYWRERKRQWVDLGLQSEVGRDDSLMDGYASAVASYARYRGVGENHGFLSPGTSLFDPVLAELLVRWYSPPGGRVLDPFAGGSVRGVVSAVCGRQYTGVDLRPEQVAANEEQAGEILPQFAAPLASMSDYTPECTPVERRGDYWVKRDDAWVCAGAAGAKARTMFADATAQAAEGIITAGARRSPQIERAALVAAALDTPCRVHVPDGADTPEIETCRAAGAEVVKHQNGRLTVLRARFREDTEARPGWYAVPFGMGLESYVDSVAGQVANLPAEVGRIVVPCGSGTTTAGIVRGLQSHGRSDVTVLAVVVGHEPAEYLDAYAPSWREVVTLVESDVDYDEDAPDTMLEGLALDPMYEAKCLPHLEAGDLLWCVGIRRDTPASSEPELGDGLPEPQWITGDAREIAALVPGEDEGGAAADLLLTCPPYFDLEQYSDNPDDLSNSDGYEGFLDDYRACLEAAGARMAEDAFAAIVVGAVRDKNGDVQDIPADTTRIMESLGWRLHQDAILAQPIGTAPIRASRPFGANRRLARVHQVINVYRRGDLSRVRGWPLPEVGSLVAEGDQDEGDAGHGAGPETGPESE